jgi:hypothetical protein
LRNNENFLGARNAFSTIQVLTQISTQDGEKVKMRRTFLLIAVMTSNPTYRLSRTLERHHIQRHIRPVYTQQMFRISVFLGGSGSGDAQFSSTNLEWKNLRFIGSFAPFQKMKNVLHRANTDILFRVHFDAFDMEGEVK